MESRIFRWACFALAAITAGTLLWIVNDMRVEVKRTNETIDQHLPAVLANVKTATETLANVSKDIESLRDLTGLTTGTGDRSLVQYADSILDFLETQQGKIGRTKTLGDGLKDVVPVQDWVAGARKEALWLSFRADTKQELLDRLGKTKFGEHWMFAPASGAPVPLIDFLKQQHPDSKGL